MKNLIFLLLILAGSVYLRAYTVSAGLPYFYDEDEAHHFNRTVNMAKSGDLNPNYFHKPSLHFYLRIPVVYASAYWSKHKGYLKDINDIRTYNKFGIADYAFTASHPGIVKWNRALSIFFSVLIIILTYLTGTLISKSNFCGLLAAAGVSISPPLIDYAGTIGVDTLMSMMCLFCVYFSLKALESKRNLDLIVAAAFAGLACSSKYNALPVVATPLIAAYLSKKLNKKTFLICCLVPVLSFFAASPYILISLPLFISDLSYEIWHYSTAGHIGHSANPGIEQVLFYADWFYKDALGLIFSICALAGFLFLTIKPDRLSIAFLSFPVLYFTMMALQRANFVRNMLVILPFLFILSALAVYRLLSYLNIGKTKVYIFSIIIFLLAAVQPSVRTYENKLKSLSRTESRHAFTKWVFEEDKSNLQTGISGLIQAVPQILLTLKNYTTVDTATENLFSLWLKGFDRLILSNANLEAYPLELMKLTKSFPGLKENSRIIENPDIKVYEIDESRFPLDILKTQIDQCNDCKAACRKSGNLYTCGPESKESNEDYLWLNKRLIALELPGLSEALKSKNKIELVFELMSPWVNELRFYNSGKSAALNTAGTWEKHIIQMETTDLISSDRILVYTKNISSPFKQGVSGDKRLLGIAVKNVFLK